MWEYVARSCLLYSHTFIYYSHAFNTHILHVKETNHVVIIRVIWRLHSKDVKHFITCDRQQASGELVSSTQILGILPLNTSFSVNIWCIFRQLPLTALSSLRDCICDVTPYKVDITIQPQFFLRGAICDILLPKFYLIIFLLYFYS